jgi:hypothetical protein
MKIKRFNAGDAEVSAEGAEEMMSAYGARHCALSVILRVLCAEAFSMLPQRLKPWT